MVGVLDLGGGRLCWDYLAKYHGVVIDVVGIDREESNGDAILGKIADGIRARTRLISVSHILSSTGLRMPISGISSIARSRGVLCIVDGAQGAGAVKVDLKELGCHAYATSGHKWLMGPKGTGLLYIAQEARDQIRPLPFKVSHDTYNDGNGVVNLAAILGLGKAIEYLEATGIERVEAHNLSLRNRLHRKLLELDALEIASPPAGPLASPMLAAVLPSAIDRRDFVKRLLDRHRLSIRPTHDQFGFNGIRFSLHVFNSEREVDFAAEAVRAELRA